MRIFFVAFFCLAVPSFGSEELDLARANLKEWVKVEKSISLEKQSWRSKKEVILDLIGVLEKDVPFFFTGHNPSFLCELIEVSISTSTVLQQSLTWTSASSHLLVAEARFLRCRRAVFLNARGS